MPSHDVISSAEVDNVKLPDKICCASCKKYKALAQFSNKQLTTLRFRVRRGGGNVSTNRVIRCRGCCGSQPFELYCGFCNLTKSIDEFSLAQRKARDDARCMTCVYEMSKVEPDDRLFGVGRDNDDLSWKEDDDYPRNYFEMDENDDYVTEGSTNGVSLGSHCTSPTAGSSLGSFSAASSIHDLQETRLTSDNLAAHTGRVLGRSAGHPRAETGHYNRGSTVTAGSFAGLNHEDDDDDDDDEDNANDDAWTASSGSQPGVSFRGFDHKGVEHRRHRAPSTILSGDWDPWATPAPAKLEVAGSKTSTKQPLGLGGKTQPSKASSKLSKYRIESLYDSDDDD